MEIVKWTADVIKLCYKHCVTEIRDYYLSSQGLNVTVLS